MKRNETERERRCLVTGDSGPAHALLRFVIAPDGSLVPDLRAELPGRGYWVSARRGLVDQAVKKHAFERAVARAHKDGGATPPSVDPLLADRVGELLARSVLNLLGMARRAGLVFTGYEKVKSTLAERPDALLVAAVDGSPDGRRKLARPGRKVLDLFDRATLSLALGKENVVHAAVLPEGLGARFIAEAQRLMTYRTEAAPPRPNKASAAPPRSDNPAATAPRRGKAFHKGGPRGPRSSVSHKSKASMHE